MPELITEQTTVREVVTRYPGAEAIFDRHGLSGCGGADGPVEPVGFFARIHKVDPEALIRELNEYAAGAEPARERVSMTDDASPPYRLFLATALALTLVAGVSTGIAAAMTGGGWGALRGEAWLALVQSHGHLQLFGFIGLFVMGMAYHILPRFKGVQPPDRRIVLASFALAVAGVLARVLAQPHGQGWLSVLLGVSGVLELAGIGVFAGVIARLFWQSRDRLEPSDRIVGAATLGLFAAAAINAYLILDVALDAGRVIGAAADDALLLTFVYGFVLLFILGVSSRVLPFFAALPEPRTRLLDAALAVIAVALPLRVAAAWSLQGGPNDWSEPVAAGATFAIALAVVAAVAGLRVFESRAGSDAPIALPLFAPMMRVAYGWLVAGVALDVYWRLRELEGAFTPLYAAGAIRHALLLGFATTMIMAMAYRTVPVFSGRPLRWPSMIPIAFVLVLAAGVLRVFPVAFATAPADLDFKLMTAGGFLLFAGLMLFAAEMTWLMFGWPALRSEQSAPAAAATATATATVPASNGAVATRGPFRPDTVVADALAVSPIVLQVLLDYGFGPLADPEMRARMAPTITLERAATFVGSTPEALVATLNAAVAAQPQSPNGDGRAPIDIKLIDTPVTEDALLAALKSCYDPEIPVDIVELGLVYSVTVRDAYAHITMTLTAPGCPMADEVEQQVRDALLKLDGIEQVDVDVVQTPEWTPARMSPAARAAVGW